MMRAQTQASKETAATAVPPGDFGDVCVANRPNDQPARLTVARNDPDEVAATSSAMTPSDSGFTPFLSDDVQQRIIDALPDDDTFRRVYGAVKGRQAAGEPARCLDFELDASGLLFYTAAGKRHGCPECMKAKPRRRPTYGDMEPVATPRAPLMTLCVDFVTGLPGQTVLTPP
ncbi:hypothetical protein MKX07_002389 [Trichoderma sp. CBMAI-0711]|nr:hypothetical protein MKX07_002389 [Trichoderma sp. CBMAI-0711]